MRLVSNADTARTLANVILGAAALGAAVVVLRTPSLRRLAFGLARTAVTVTLPVWLSREVKQAWTDSGARGPSAPPVPPA
ncbi:MAG: hypothetical protein WD227_03940 [Vicinamibacterales bacterium]